VAEKVGFIRLGKIDNPMSRNMLKAGFPLVVYDVNPVAIDWLVKEGDVLRWTRQPLDRLAQTIQGPQAPNQSAIKLYEEWAGVEHRIKQTGEPWA
jgi:6-phosphogluconate dehydrogenase (decarboxylating)